MSARSHVRHNISIMGPPGSGKGSYGLQLAEFLSIPFITVSTLLKQAELDTASGKLVDDETVSEILVRHLPKNQPYLLDGFPRTLNQVKLMESDWPIAPVTSVISLEVPRQVCLEKMIGRRICTICNRNWNMANVQLMSFDLPASLPDNCTMCSPPSHWRQRTDDVPEIIEDRLDIFYSSSAPILDHYEARGKLLRFTPNLGYLDMPRFKVSVANWLQDMHSDMQS